MCTLNKLSQLVATRIKLNKDYYDNAFPLHLSGDYSCPDKKSIMKIELDKNLVILLPELEGLHVANELKIFSDLHRFSNRRAREKRKFLSGENVQHYAKELATGITIILRELEKLYLTGKLTK